MPPLVTIWDRVDLSDHVDDVLGVYADAMQVARHQADSRRGLLLSHLDRDDLRAVAAHDDGRLVGIAYGYRGRPGQWWTDQVRAAMDANLADVWLTDAFEVCELHVRPPQQGLGVGRALLDTLLDGVGTRTAVLTTPDEATRARGFYRAAGWRDLLRGMVFPGDPRTFAVLGKQL